MDTNRIPKQALHYGGVNFILRMKEQETHLILHEHDDIVVVVVVVVDDDDDDDYDEVVSSVSGDITQASIRAELTYSPFTLEDVRMRSYDTRQV
jgi:hypothetical protein